MMGASYPSKKALRENIGKRLRYVETSLFSAEYRDNGMLTVVGPCPFNARKWYANVTMKDGLIAGVK
jgi:hypothetical protein